MQNSRVEQGETWAESREGKVREVNVDVAKIGCISWGRCKKRGRKECAPTLIIKFVLQAPSMAPRYFLLAHHLAHFFEVTG